MMISWGLEIFNSRERRGLTQRSQSYLGLREFLIVNCQLLIVNDDFVIRGRLVLNSGEKLTTEFQGVRHRVSQSW